MASLPPHTGPWRSPCVSRTAALAGGTVFGGDLGNSVVSRVPATLGMCPCHSPETPSGLSSPVSVPAQAPPPWEGWLHASVPSGSEDTYWAASGPLGPWDPPSHLHSAPPPPPRPQPREHPQGCHLPGVLQGPPLSAPALKRGPVIRPSPPPPWDALKGSTSASDRASLFISNPFFPGSC